MSHRARRLGRVLVCVVLCLTGCVGGRDTGHLPAAGLTVRVASYDFSENQTLAQVYAHSLRRAGFHVDVVDGIGTREVVIPALQQGRVDMVLDYLGTALNFVDPSATAGVLTSAQASAALAAPLSSRHIKALPPSTAEDKNGFAVTAAFSRQHGVAALSDLVPIAGTLVFGAPPECPVRRYCLLGLRHTYGLTFRAFRPMESRNATVAALNSAEIDVGLLETTDARLAGGRLRLLDDDRRLQPHENVVPLVRTTTVAAGGARLTAAINAVSARLATSDLISLNQAVEIRGVSPSDAAADWVRKNRQ